MKLQNSKECKISTTCFMTTFPLLCNFHYFYGMLLLISKFFFIFFGFFIVMFLCDLILVTLMDDQNIVRLLLLE